MSGFWLPLVGLLALLGFADAFYLSLMHYQGSDVGCSVITGCDAVLSSEYAYLLGIPLAYLGVLYYLSVLFSAVLYYQTDNRLFLKASTLIVGGGFIFTLWLIYLQAVVINAFCQFCLISALLTTLMAVLLTLGLRKYSLED
ncbi:MAG: putative membrane protein [Bacteroidetes bacterium HLUCCA01]|nr:MAG: putative membrane protein [Bacteroidetes bacterium HLUCCA01]